MEKIIVTCCILLVIIGIGYTQTRNTTTVTEQPAQSVSNGEGRTGVWQGTLENERVCMTLASRSDNSSWMNGTCFAVSEFSALPVAEADFTVTREAGTITFRGKFEGKEGYGRFTFSPNQAFSGWLGEQGISGVDDNMLMYLFFANTGKDYVASLKKAGYGEINAEELSRLAIHEVSQKDLNDYQEIAKDFSGSRPSIDDLIDLKIHGVDRNYIAALQKSGFPKLTLDNIRDAKIHEIDPEYIRRCRDMGFPNLTFDEIMNFKIHELTPEYLKGLKDAGLTSLSADEALNMRIHDVTPAVISELRKMGFKKLTPDDIINLRVHEITPAFLSDMQSLGFKDLSTDDAVNLRVHEIDRAFVQELGKAGFNGLSVNDAVNCKIHEVNPASIREFNELGFSKISVDDAVNLRIHDVTPAFIRSMREKGFKDLSLEEYIGLKIQYGDKMK